MKVKPYRNPRLAEILGIDAATAADYSIVGQTRIWNLTAAALKAERRKSSENSYHYDLVRHLALKDAYLCEMKALYTQPDAAILRAEIRIRQENEHRQAAFNAAAVAMMRSAIQQRAAA